MSRNRKKYNNTIEVSVLVRWGVAFVFLAIFGLSYVFLQVQLNQGGSAKDQQERELKRLVAMNDVVSAQIAALTTRAALQRRLDEGFIQLKPIETDRIVRLDLGPTRRGGENQIRAVSNPGPNPERR